MVNDNYEDFNNEMAEMTQRDIEEQMRELGTPVAPEPGVTVTLFVDAGLTYQGETLMSRSFHGKVDAETLMKVTELLEKGVVL